MKVHKCRNCTFFTVYYKQWSSHFARLSEGRCSKHNEFRTQFQTCEHFEINDAKEKRRENDRLENLDRAMQALVDIAQILKEKEAEKGKNN